MADVITLPQIRLKYNGIGDITIIRKQLELLGVILKVRKGAQTFYVRDEIPETLEALDDLYFRTFYSYTLPGCYYTARDYILECGEQLNYKRTKTDYAKLAKAASHVLRKMANDLPDLPDNLLAYRRQPKHASTFGIVWRPTHDCLLKHCGRVRRLDNAYGLILFISHKLDIIAQELNMVDYNEVGEAIRKAIIEPYEGINIPYMFRPTYERRDSEIGCIQ